MEKWVDIHPWSEPLILTGSLGGSGMPTPVVTGGPWTGLLQSVVEQIQTHSHTKGPFSISNLSDMHVFQQREETGSPGQKTKGVPLWDLVTVEATAYDLHHDFYTDESYCYLSCPVDEGIVILKETTPVMVEMLQV